MNRIWKMTILIATIVLLDQFTKGIIESRFHLGESLSVIDGLFNITYVRNPGAAFGFLATAPDFIRGPMFLFIPSLACIWLVILIWQNRKTSLFLSLAYTLILAGAIGNLIDRFTLSYVVDFLDFFWRGYHFPAFNVADSCISIAAGMLILDFFKQLKKAQKDKNQDEADPL